MKREIKHAYEIKLKSIPKEYDNFIHIGDMIPDYVCGCFHDWFPCIAFDVRVPKNHNQIRKKENLGFSVYFVLAEDFGATVGHLFYNDDGEICIDDF